MAKAMNKGFKKGGGGLSKKAAAKAKAKASSKAYSKKGDALLKRSGKRSTPGNLRKTLNSSFKAAGPSAAAGGGGTG